MNEVEALVSELQLELPADWVDGALAALINPSMRFRGSLESTAASSAAELIGIYEIRLAHLRERAIWSVGLEFLLQQLHAMHQSATVSVLPFTSDTHAVTAFYASSKRLISCVTLEHDRDGGMRNLVAALGQE